jgi:hypothetical protein
MDTLELYDTGSEADLRASGELLAQFAEHITFCPTSRDAIDALISLCAAIQKPLRNNPTQLYPLLCDAIGPVAQNLPQSKEAKLRARRVKAAKAFLNEITSNGNVLINKQDILKRESGAIEVLKKNGAQIKDILSYLNRYYKTDLSNAGLKAFSRSDLQRFLSIQKSKVASEH